MTKQLQTVKLISKLPWSISSKLTPSQVRVLGVIIKQVKFKNVCVLCNEKIAHFAKVSLRTVQYALKRMRELGFIFVQYRRISYCRNLSSIITIGSKKLVDWVTGKQSRGSTPKWAKRVAPYTALKAALGKECGLGLEASASFAFVSRGLDGFPTARDLVDANT